MSNRRILPEINVSPSLHESQSKLISKSYNEPLENIYNKPEVDINNLETTNKLGETDSENATSQFHLNGVSNSLHIKSVASQNPIESNRLLTQKTMKEPIK